MEKFKPRKSVKRFVCETLIVDKYTYKFVHSNSYRCFL